MKISISNFRGIASALIESGKITLIAGMNHAGKTSVMQAISSALTGRVIPVDGLPKTQIGLLVRSGTASGSVDIETENGSSKITWPVSESSTSGAPVTISEYAAGIKTLLDTPKKDRAEIISDLLKTKPTAEELKAELLKLNFPEKTIDKLQLTIDAQGWDSAHAMVKESGATMKGQWRQITGEQWGEKKSGDWFPNSWDADLENATPESLTELLHTEQGFLEAAISDTGVSAAEVERLKTIASTLPELVKTGEALKIKVGQLTDSEFNIRTALNTMPPATQTPSMCCPHCQKPVALINDKLAIPKILTDEELKTRAENIKTANETLKTAQQALEKSRSELSDVNSKSDAARKAERDLKTMKPATGADAQKRIDDLRARVKRAEDRIAAKKSKTEADIIHAKILQNQVIVELISPNGIRLKKLKSSVGAFNASLRKISDVAKWQPVTLSDDMGISYHGTPYMLLSKSEQFRVSVVLQIGISLIDGSKIVLIDGADILDSAGRNGLFGALVSLGIEAIVAMTINKSEEVPNLSKFGGVSYWIGNAEATKLHG
jgi:hypothetical protein